MTKKEFIDKFAAMGYTKKDAKIIIADFEDLLHRCIMDCDSVTLRGVGSFHVRMAAEKRVPNSVNPDKKVSPAHPVVKFYPSEQLRIDLANGVKR